MLDSQIPRLTLTFRFDKPAYLYRALYRKGILSTEPGSPELGPSFHLHPHYHDHQHNHENQEEKVSHISLQQQQLGWEGLQAAAGFRLLTEVSLRGFH